MGLRTREEKGGRVPYSVRKDGRCPASKPWAAVKTSDGKVLGCHESKAGAERQVAAVNISEHKRSRFIERFRAQYRGALDGLADR